MGASNKRIFDVNCILCKRFWTCNGKASKEQLCVNFEKVEDKKNGGCKVDKTSNGRV